VWLKPDFNWVEQVGPGMGSPNSHPR